MNKELEEAIKKSLSNKERGTCVISAEILETVLNYIDNSISKEVIEEKIEELKQRTDKYREYTELGIETDVEYLENVADRECIKVLQELLEGK